MNCLIQSENETFISLQSYLKSKQEKMIPHTPQTQILQSPQCLGHDLEEGEEGPELPPTSALAQ